MSRVGAVLIILKGHFNKKYLGADYGSSQQFAKSREGGDVLISLYTLRGRICYCLLT